MQISLDDTVRFTSPLEVAEKRSNAPDHEIWFRVKREGLRDEFFYIKASPRIPESQMQEIIQKLVG